MPGKPTSKRKRLSEREVIDVLLAQGALIRCGHCKLPIMSGAEALREHVHQLALSGDDTMGNWSYWHVLCSHRKTHGTKATSAGSDAHARAKIRRLTGKNKVKPKRKIPSRPFQRRKK